MYPSSVKEVSILNQDLTTALYEAMAKEQANFRDWLVKQPPEEILNHTYEYTVREDILMAMEELELPREQGEALLSSPSPLADVYRHFSDLETGYMDLIRDSIESRAQEKAQEQQQLYQSPIYPHDGPYAREHGELEQYRTSRKANFACKEAIEAAIRENFDGMHLNPDAVKSVVGKFSEERVSHVLANTIQQKDWDTRFSNSNRSWASAFPMFEPQDRRREYTVESHPAVLDGFVSLFREEREAKREQPSQAAEKPSIRELLAARPAPQKPASRPKDREAR